jgi:DNA adenine methylase
MCFNGVYRTNRLGEFNVPRGSRTGGIPDEATFYRCSVALRAADLRVGDFDSCLVDAGPKDFVYLDPPYSASDRSRYGEYGYGSFSETDAPRLLDCLRRLDDIGTAFLLSYAASPTTLKQLSRWNCVRHLVRHHISGFARHRAIVEEVLVTNQPLIQF